jgi:hypothetical protein
MGIDTDQRVLFRGGSRVTDTSGHCSIRGWAYFSQAVRILFRNSLEGSLEEFLPAKSSGNPPFKKRCFIFKMF